MNIIQTINSELTKPTRSVQLILSHDVLCMILSRNIYSRAVYHISLERMQKVVFEKRVASPSWKLIYLLQKFHSVELYREKRLRIYSETTKLSQTTLLFDLMPKQTIFRDIRTNASRKKNGICSFPRRKQRSRVTVTKYTN